MCCLFIAMYTMHCQLLLGSILLVDVYKALSSFIIYCLYIATYTMHSQLLFYCIYCLYIAMYAMHCQVLLNSVLYSTAVVEL